MILVSRNIRFMRIFVGVPGEGASIVGVHACVRVFEHEPTFISYIYCCELESCIKQNRAVAAGPAGPAGATENASPVKCNTMKMTDQIAALEFARPGK